MSTVGGGGASSAIEWMRLRVTDGKIVEMRPVEELFQLQQQIAG